MSLIPISLPGNIQFDIEGFPQENDYITSCMKKFNNWEPNLSEKFRAILDQAEKHQIKGIVLDIGACFGYYSLIASQSGFRATAIEPNPETLEILKRNVQLSGKGLISIIEIGLGHVPGQKTIKIAEDNIGGSSLIEPELHDDHKIEIRRLDDQLIDEKIIICKIDVEGYEPAVIRGGLETIRRAEIDFIFLEISSKFCSIESLIEDIIVPLWQEGYFSFDIGLQDSGELQDANKKFRKVSSHEELTILLRNIEQTNFLFIRKNEPASEYLTGDTWKDNLLMKWSEESSNALEMDIKKLENELAYSNYKVEEEKKENSKVFEELMKAAAFQKELLAVIQHKDKIITEIGNLIKT